MKAKATQHNPAIISDTHNVSLLPNLSEKNGVTAYAGISTSATRMKFVYLSPPIDTADSDSPIYTNEFVILCIRRK
jgi:hypothetical protein